MKAKGYSTIAGLEKLSQEEIKQRNLETYGNEFGPTPDSLYEKYGSWDMVMMKALGTNPGMDACLGFYDEYYYLYQLEDADGEE